MNLEVFQHLKDWLRDRQKNYVEHNSMMGDTEGGFYSTDDFDFSKLCAEIDAFAEELKKEGRS